MKRLHAIRNALFNEEGLAVILKLEFTDGTKQDIEVVRSDMRELIAPLLHICHALGERQANSRPLTATTPAEAVRVPADELHAVTRDQNGALWLVVRVGSEDLAFAFPDPQAARLLGEALLAATP